MSANVVATEAWPLAEGVHHRSACDLRAVAGTWAFARNNADAIAANWQKETRAKPAYFNGKIHLAQRIAVDTQTFSAELIATDFASFLYWRALGQPAAGVLDVFGSALLIGSDGGVVLGQQRDGNVNSGRLYMPGGFIDPRDVGDDGTIDIAASAARELIEETGLAPGREVERQSGFYVTRCGPLVSIAVSYRAEMTAIALAEHVRHTLAADPDGELVDAVAVRTARDMDRFDVPEFARLLVAHVLG